MKTTKSKRGKFTIIILLRLPVQSLDAWASETIVPDARKKMKNPGKFECYVVRNDEKFAVKINNNNNQNTLDRCSVMM